MEERKTKMMKEEKRKSFMPMNLQIFAEGEKDDKDDVNDDGKGTDKGTGTDESGKDEKKEKTFTQEEVTRMMAREKKQGRAALLKELGYKDEKQAKAASSSYQAWLESQKTEEQKSAEKDSENEKAVLEAQAKADAAEAKVEALMLGCKPGNVDDVIALAMAKKTDDGDFKTIVGELKKKYPDMFSKSSDDEDNKDDKKSKGQKGTGGNVSAKSKDKKDEDKNQSLGSRLAASRRGKKDSGKKSFWS